jgi:predicted TIM-barrel fold metal-dependent hydrolase
MERVVLVQPSVYADDNACLVNALKALGPDVARGIAVIDPATVTEAGLRVLHDAGVRGVRINLEVRSEERRDTAAKAIRAAADKVAPLGWSVQVYADVEVIGGIAEVLESLPVPVILDHFAGVKADRGSNQAGLADVLRLMETGHVYTKMSALYRASRAASGYVDLKPIAQAFAAANPDRVIWASDWPHTGSSSARAPDQLGAIEPFRQIDDVSDRDLLRSWLPEQTHMGLFAANAARLYQF